MQTKLVGEWTHQQTLSWLQEIGADETVKTYFIKETINGRDLTGFNNEEKMKLLKKDMKDGNVKLRGRSDLCTNLAKIIPQVYLLRATLTKLSDRTRKSG
jgi:nitrogenase molybdenum-iron protein alpha/beta subunit